MSSDVAELSAEEKAAVYEEKAAAYDRMVAEQAEAKKANAGPDRYKVIVSDPGAMDRTLFSSVSANRARTYVEQRCPRGQHIFVLAPDGTMESYEAERLTGGPRGEDVDAWQEFDREAYSSPELSPVNSSDPWADAWEGAQ
jgi:hypothetical protein